MSYLQDTNAHLYAQSKMAYINENNLYGKLIKAKEKAKNLKR